jgi:hypothetical protein
MGWRTIKRGAEKQWVEGKTFRLADEVRYMQRRAAQRQSRIVTIGQLVLFSTETGDAWLLDPSDLLAAPGPGWRSAISGDRRDRYQLYRRLERKVPDRWSGLHLCRERIGARPHHPGLPYSANRSTSRIAELPEADR